MVYRGFLERLSIALSSAGGGVLTLLSVDACRALHNRYSVVQPRRPPSLVIPHIMAH